MTDNVNTGYTSGAALGLHAKLLQFEDKGWAVHSRVLGNVLYLMTSLTVSRATVSELEALLGRALD